jgi:predicted nucleic acid-binding Zn ribbon protein
MGKVIGMGGKDQPKTKVKLDLNDLTDIVCENCEGKFFRQVSAFKKISPLVSPTGKEQIIPVPVFRCDECGHINKEFLPVKSK